MKRLSSLILIGSMVFFWGCKKDLPPLRCNQFLFEYAPYAPSPDIDSVYLFMQRTDVPNGMVFDTMVYGPINSFHFSFCGVFKYKVRVYNSTPGLKYDMQIWVNGQDGLLGGPRVVNGHIDDNYEYENEFLY